MYVRVSDNRQGLRDRDNYMSLMAVLAGLSNPAVQQLRSAWPDLLSPELFQVRLCIVIRGCSMSCSGTERFGERLGVWSVGWWG